MGTTAGDFADEPLRSYIEAWRTDPPPLNAERSVAELRQGFRDRVAAYPPGPGLAEVRDLQVPGEPDVPARLYRPSSSPRPVLVYAHGGGWVVGDLETHDSVCRRIAAAADVAVLAVDYRRAPEHPWPAAVDDVVTVLSWAGSSPAELGSTGVVGVAGDSAGGHLATSACLRLLDEGRPLPAAQLLAYPNTDLTLNRASAREEKATGWGLRTADAAWFAEQFVPDADERGDGRVSPLHAEDLAGLPPALVVSCEHDPLRDEAEAYAERLDRASVPVRRRREAGMVHGFLLLDTVSPAAAAACDRFCADVRTVLRS